MTSKVWSIKEQIEGWANSEFKSFALWKMCSRNEKTGYRPRENIWKSDTSNKGLMSRICEDLSKLKIKGGQKIWTGTSTRKVNTGKEAHEKVFNVIISVEGNED